MLIEVHSSVFLQKLDNSMRESLAASSVLAEKVVAGKMSKDQYTAQEDQADKSRKAILEKMDALANQL